MTKMEETRIYSLQNILCSLPVHDSSTGLVVRKQQSIRNNHILPTSSCKNNRLGDIIRREGLTSTRVGQMLDTFQDSVYQEVTHA